MQWPHLTAAIENVQGEDQLLWYVDNGSEFAAIDKTTIIVGGSESTDVSYGVTFRASGGSTWPAEVATSSGSEHMDCLFAPKVLDSVYSGRTDRLQIEL